MSFLSKLRGRPGPVPPVTEERYYEATRKLFTHVARQPHGGWAIRMDSILVYFDTSYLPQLLVITHDCSEEELGLDRYDELLEWANTITGSNQALGVTVRRDEDRARCTLTFRAVHYVGAGATDEQLDEGLSVTVASLLGAALETRINFDLGI